MSYLVLSRKYRPAAFAELVGQGHVVRTLQNAIQRKRLAHAYLLTGPRGVGKTTMARILAKAVNCHSSDQPVLEPCNVCASCAEIGEGRSMDVFEIDAASNTGVDNIRDLRDQVKFAAVRDRYRVYIIDEVHMLSTAAFNALLKTLEEPPAHVLFILATTAPDKVPLTIRSRCQHFNFRLLTREEIVGQLEAIAAKEGYHIGRPALNSVSRAAAGSLRDAEVLLEQVIAYAGDEPRETVVEDILQLVEGEVIDRFIRGVAARDAAVLIRVIDELAARGFDMKRFLWELTEWIRGMMLIRLSPELADLIPLVEEDRRRLAERAGEFSGGRLQVLAQTAIATELELKNTANPRYVMELAALRMCQAEDFEAVDILARRLEDLAGRLAAGAGGRGGGPEQAAAGPGRAGVAPARGEDQKKTVDPAADEDAEEEEVTPQTGGEGGGNRLRLEAEEPADPAPADEWERFVAQVKKRKMVLGSYLAHGRMIGRDPQGMVIGFPKAQSIFLESVQENEHPKILQEVAAGLYGEKFRLRFELMEEDTGAKQAEAKENDLMNRKRTEAKNNPLVQEIIDAFGGQVMEIRIL